ncbi:MAG: hypothetical protein EWM45_11635 [Rhodopseudomonas palustris]|nr:MAG: hypothetical protein EWM45_11635 [Rhodopseudomonas palustris]
MTLYLLDTNVLSNLSKTRPSPSVLNWCHRLRPRHWCIAQCTIIEIRRGIKILSLKGERARADTLDKWFENLLAMRPRIIALNDTIIDVLTDLSLVPELQNVFAPNPGKYPARIGRDLEIAATAIAMKATVVTINVSDFLAINEHIRLPGLFNPDTGQWFVRQRRREADLATEQGHWDMHRRLSTKIIKF